MFVVVPSVFLSFGPVHLCPIDPYGRWPKPYTAFVLSCQFLGSFRDLGSVRAFVRFWGYSGSFQGTYGNPRVVRVSHVTVGIVSG